MTQPKTKPSTASVFAPGNYILTRRQGVVWGCLRDSFHCPRCEGEGRLFTQNEKGISFLQIREKIEPIQIVISFFRGFLLVLLLILHQG